MNSQCAECDATVVDDVTCLDCFHALLAYENERPAAFVAVHHLTVACYYLQHPAGYGSDVLRAWTEVLAPSRTHGETQRELQQRMGRRFSGAVRVRDADAARPRGWPRDWTMRVGDLIRPGAVPDIDEYIGRARRWASETRTSLETARPSAAQ